MRTFLIMIVIVLTSGFLFAQKAILDSNAFKLWPRLGLPTITDDGKYLMYTVDYPSGKGSSLVLVSTDGKWKKEYLGEMNDARFSSDSKTLIFSKNEDSVGTVKLGTDLIRSVRKDESVILKINGKDKWRLYSSANNPGTLLIKDFSTKYEMRFNNVVNRTLAESEKFLIVEQELHNKPEKFSLKWMDLWSGKTVEFWKGNKAIDLIIDQEHRQLAFLTSDSIWYYKLGAGKPIWIADSNSASLKQGLRLDKLNRFSRDGGRIFLHITEKDKTRPIAEGVEIWSYNDSKIQSEQLADLHPQDYLAVLDLATHQIIQLQDKEISGIVFPDSKLASDSVALYFIVENPKEFWSKKYRNSVGLISTRNGSTKELKLPNDLSISPTGKYLFYYDSNVQGYYSYEISTGRIRSLTEGLNVSWASTYRDDASRISSTRGGAASAIWLPNDERVLVYDSNDIWKLDPLNRSKPVNLTNGYGRRHKIILDFTFKEDLINGINHSDKIYLTAFNSENKNNGFYRMKSLKGGDPVLLTMGAYLFDSNSGYVPWGSNFTPFRAKDAKMFIVRRMNATDAPNYYSTKDFKVFDRLSDLQPQKKYNWYTTELHTWKSLDGRMLQGVLYKPENFDPNKKYPVIFNYYERKSDGLNAYLKPELLCGGCAIDISTYVSNGYLVFTPDIYYKIGDPMQGTYDALVSAGNYLSSYPFVNSKKMGIQGCSFGGLQTNYLVTHTDMFAAATSSSSLSDLVSSYGSIPDGISSLQDYFEHGQARIGASLWQEPEAYIRNSPIFQVHMVTTPLLMMHTKKDDVYSYSDAIQFFTGLRRMGKKAWMLVYSDSRHGLSTENEAKDFSIRMMQFFDHYLKDKPTPVWMLEGVSARDRSWKAGLELDSTGRTPGIGLLNDEEQSKLDSLMNKKPVTINLR